MKADYKLLPGRIVVPVEQIKGEFVITPNILSGSIPGITAPGDLVRDNPWAAGLTTQDFGLDIVIKTISVRNTPVPPSVKEVTRSTSRIADRPPRKEAQNL